MNLHLRKAEVADIPTLISIEQSVTGSKLYSAMLTNEEWIEALGKNTTYLIEDNKLIVGNISYELKSESHAYIDGLVVMSEFQGKGIARKAIEMLLEKLKDIKVIDLVTHPDNVKAVKLYESFGFKTEERIENYFGDGEPRIKMVFKKSND